MPGTIINNFSSLLSPEIPGELDLNLNVGGTFGGIVQSPTSLNGRLSVKGTLDGTVRLALQQPPPILNNLSAFAKNCTPRLFADAQELGITSFTLEAPKAEIGKRLSVTLTNQALANASPAKKYTFQIGERSAPLGAPVWRTLISNADLDSRNVAIRFRGDNLQLSVVSPAEDALRLFPGENSTVYNPDKTEFDTSQIEKLPDELGALFAHVATPVRSLNLYKLLEYVRKKVGLAALQTNIPNYEITRADFSLSQSFRDSLAPFFGAYETLWLSGGSSIQIIDKSQIVPEDFEPFVLTVEPPGTEPGVDRFLSWQMEMPAAPRRDGFILVSSASDLEADAFEDTTQTLPTSESGTFGTNDFSRIVTQRTTRRWFHSDNPDITFRSEIIREVITTHAPIPPYTVTLSVVGRDTSEHFFDRTGKRISSTRKIENRVKQFEGDGTILLKQVSDETQDISYVTHPDNPRRFIQSQIVTSRNGLIAVDEANPYYNPQTGEEGPFEQDFTLANEAGNLADGITTRYGPIQKTIENTSYLGNNQFQTTVQTISYLRGTAKPGISEPKAGDASIGGTTARTRRLVVYRDGYTHSTRSVNYGFEEFSIGELPLEFAKDLAKRKLAARFTKKQVGSLEIGGFSNSVKRGALLTVKDRSGNSYGRFIVEGFTVTGERLERDGWQLTTRLDVAEI